MRLIMMAIAYSYLVTLVVGLASNTCSAQSDSVQSFAGEWLYVEDRTEGRPVEKQQPPMSVKFTLRVEEDAVVWVRPRGDERMVLDGSTREVAKTGSTTNYRGEWKDGALEYDVETVRNSDKARLSLIRRKFRITPEGMLIHVVIGEPPMLDSVALYRHPNDIELPKSAKAAIADMEWLTGAWVGKQGNRAIEERWSPIRGGAMLGTSRTVKGDKMVGFEYLRIVERDGSLVYIAQPGGRSATEFLLTKLAPNRAVFLNPRHDYPQRITYELSEGGLTASIGYAKGGKPRRFEFTRERENDGKAGPGQ